MGPQTSRLEKGGTILEWQMRKGLRYHAAPRQGICPDRLKPEEVFTAHRIFPGSPLALLCPHRIHVCSLSFTPPFPPPP